MADIVSNSHLFKSLDDEGRRSAIECARVAVFHEADVLLKQDDPSDAMYILLDGTVRVETLAPGAKVMLAELGRGACVGEVGALTGNARTATVTARTEVKVIRFAKSDIDSLLTRYPKVHKLLLALVEHRARDTIEKIIG